MRIRCVHLVVWWFLFSTHLLFSLDPNRAITQYNLRAWGTDNGLPQASILALVQTRDGYLWIGTQEGLVRFDGIHFLVFEEAFTPGLSGNFVNALCEDAEGGLWIGTLKGISRYDHGDFQSFNTRNGLPDNNIITLCAAADGSVWIGTSNGLSRWRKGRFHNFSLADGLCDPGIERIFIDSSGRLWVGTRRGLCMSPSVNSPRFVTHPACREQRITGICQDREGTIWIGTDGGLFYHKGKGPQQFARVQDLGSEDVQSLYADRLGTLWIGTRTGGLKRLHDGHISSLGTRQGLPDDWVCSLVEDQEGFLWVGTSTGLVHLQDGKFICIGSPEGLSHDVVFALHQGRDGVMWIGTNRGLNRIQNGLITQYFTTQGLSNDVVNAICITPRDEVWIGTDAGLNCLRRGRFAPFPGREAMANLMIYSILMDASGALWVSTVRGAFCIERNRITRYDSQNKLPGDHVNFVFIDRGDNIWFSVYDRGLVRKQKNGTMTVFTEKEGLASNMVNAVHEEDNGDLWFGTMNGLSRFHNERFTSLTKKHGLFHDSVFVILEDKKGNLWMSSNKGIFRMKKADLQAVADGRQPTAPATLFGRKDGMRTPECNSSGLQVGMEDLQGRFWFATMKGAVMIDPQHLMPSKPIPTVTLEEFSVNNRMIRIPPASAPKPLQLAAGSRNFLFRFSAPSLSDPEGLVLRYTLEGYDQNWQTAGSERLTRYTNLPSGEYRFRVIAGNSDGVWNYEGTALPFRMKSFFYQTPLFFILCFLGLILFTAATIHWRTRHLQKKERGLQQKIAERTEQLARLNEELRLSNASLAEQISEREKFELRLEEVNRQLQDSNIKLKELDRLKTDFINITSHELRTPLTSVLGFAQLIRRRLNELFGTNRSMDEKKKEYNVAKILESIEIIVAEGRRLTALINDMLDISKMEAGKMEWKSDRVEVEEILRQALASTASLFEAKKLHVKSHWDKNLPVITGDRDRLLQVLINLLSNAVKFTDRGTVTISAKRLNGEVVIKVRDTGCGIASEDLPFIFQKFKQLGARRSEHQGSGLGLVICKEIVEYHGGSIQVQSDPGQGSEFTVKLPSVHPDSRNPPD